MNEDIVPAYIYTEKKKVEEKRIGPSWKRLYSGSILGTGE